MTAEQKAKAERERKENEKKKKETHARSTSKLGLVGGGKARGVVFFPPASPNLEVAWRSQGCEFVPAD